MKPALSIIFFTVLSGGGFGLAVFIAVFNDLSPGAHLAAVLFSLLLVGGGLGASVLHLANPKNAWRAFMRVRTSWLSREGVLAAFFFPLMLAYAFAADAFLLRAVIVLIALFTIYCTAMIYQSLKTIVQWNHWLTAVNYLLLALISGGILFSFFSAGSTQNHALFINLILVFAAVAAKACYYRRIGACQDIRVAHATGFSRAKAKLLDAGHTAPTFLTREFIYQQSAATLSQRRHWTMAALFFAPFATIVIFIFQWPSVFAALSTALLFAGLLLERWLFFAEAHHSVRAYHGIE